jgi:hypothetical protein
MYLQGLMKIAKDFDEDMHHESSKIPNSMLSSKDRPAAPLNI